jgi:hypothetical protein
MASLKQWVTAIREELRKSEMKFIDYLLSFILLIFCFALAWMCVTGVIQL